MNLAELAKTIGGELTGDPAGEVHGAAPLSEAGPTDVAFLANPRYEKQLPGTKAAAVIVGADQAAAGEVALIRCADPYFSFRQAMVALYGFRQAPFAGVHRNAYVDPGSTVGENVTIGSSATVSAGASIGDDTVLYPGVFIGPDARMGRNCLLYPNVVVYDHCVLGDRVTIHANSVIGQDGFGYATHEGAHHKIPQAGWVELGDDVEIGACCAIDRATIGATRIGPGTKLSNLVTIGHGTELGRHDLLVAQTGIAGSTTVGDYCTFGGQAGVVGHVTIGDFAQVGAQAGVISDLPAKARVWGTPANPLRENLRQVALVRQLPELREQLAQLTRELADLRKTVDEGTRERE